MPSNHWVEMLSWIPLSHFLLSFRRLPKARRGDGEAAREVRRKPAHTPVTTCNYLRLPFRQNPFKTSPLPSQNLHFEKILLPGESGLSVHEHDLPQNRHLSLLSCSNYIIFFLHILYDIYIRLKLSMEIWLSNSSCSRKLFGPRFLTAAVS